MRRELKFRIWDGLQMQYDIVAGRFGVFYVNAGAKGDGLDPNDTASLSPFNTKCVDSIPVMQFTGILDRDLTEIYEGDIVEVNSDLYQNENFQGRVIFSEGEFLIKINNNDIRGLEGGSETKVIGHIYEEQSIEKTLSDRVKEVVYETVKEESCIGGILNLPEPVKITIQKEKFENILKIAEENLLPRVEFKRGQELDMLEQAYDLRGESLEKIAREIKKILDI